MALAGKGKRRIELFRDLRGEARWHAVAVSNDLIVATSAEGYESDAHALTMAKSFLRDGEAVVTLLDDRHPEGYPVYVEGEGDKEPPDAQAEASPPKNPVDDPEGPQEVIAPPDTPLADVPTEVLNDED